MLLPRANFNSSLDSKPWVFKARPGDVLHLRCWRKVFTLHEFSALLGGTGYCVLGVGVLGTGTRCRVTCCFSGVNENFYFTILGAGWVLELILGSLYWCWVLVCTSCRVTLCFSGVEGDFLPCSRSPHWVVLGYSTRYWPLGTLRWFSGVAGNFLLLLEFSSLGGPTLLNQPHSASASQAIHSAW